MSTEASRPVRDGDEWEKGGQKSKTSKQVPAWKTRAAADCQQNNNMVRQCPFSIAQRLPHHAIAVPTAMQNSHKDNVHSSAVGNKRLVEMTYLRMLLMTLTEGSSEGCLPGLLTGVTLSAWNPTLDAEIVMNAIVTVFLYQAKRFVL